MLLSYAPQEELPDDLPFNLHGHTHNIPLPEWITDRHINVSVEVAEYRPMMLAELVARQRIQVRQAG